jgi:hypothetical protein
MKKIIILIGILVGLTAIFIAYSAHGKRLLEAALGLKTGNISLIAFPYNNVYETN